MVGPPEAGCGVAPKAKDREPAPKAFGVSGVVCALATPRSEREVLSLVEGAGVRACSRARKTSASSDTAFFGSRARSSILFQASTYGCESRVVTDRTRMAAERMS